MRQVGARHGDRDQASPVATSRNPYIDLLRNPGAIAFSSAGFVGRMSMSMYGLGTVLLIATLTGRYGLAGTVAAAGSVGYALCSPFIAQLADRLGQRRVLLRQTAVFAVGSSTFICLAELRAPLWAMLASGALAGASMPSVGSMVRSRWSALVGSDPQRLHAAFALESVNDELIFVIGPALVTLLATQFLPASGVGTASLLCVAGTLLFAVQRGTEPTPRPRPGDGSQREPVDHTQPGLREETLRGPEAHRAGRARLPRRPRLPRRARLPRMPRLPRRPRLPRMPTAGLLTLSPAFLMLGAMFSSIDLSTVAFATELGHRPLAGFVLGTYAFGSAVGGLWYGTRRWRAPVGRRFTATAALATAGVATFWAMPGLLALGAVGFLAGLSIAPTLIAGYAILERQAPPHRRTEAMAWLSSTISVGVALGSAVVGHIIDAHGARLGFAFAACCGATAVLICLVGAGRLRAKHDHEPAQLSVAT